MFKINKIMLDALLAVSEYEKKGNHIHEEVINKVNEAIEFVTNKPENDLPIEETDFTLGTYNMLVLNKIERLSDLSKLTIEDFMKFKNYKSNSLKEAQKVLLSNGMKFAQKSK